MEVEMKQDSTFRILVVDDEQNYCDVLRLILEAENYYVKTTTRSQQALEMLEIGRASCRERV